MAKLKNNFDEAGLQKIVLDRDSFLLGDEILDYIKNSKKIKISGVALGFFVKNGKLFNFVEELLKNGGEVEFLLAHPDSEIVKFRDSEQIWNGDLANTIKNTIKNLLILKKDYPENVKINLFRGEIHNTFILTDEFVMVNPYVFGEKGWFSPIFIFSKENQRIVSGFGKQIEKMKDFSKSNQGMLVELADDRDLSL